MKHDEFQEAISTTVEAVHAAISAAPGKEAEQAIGHAAADFVADILTRFNDGIAALESIAKSLSKSSGN